MKYLFLIFSLSCIPDYNEYLDPRLEPYYRTFQIEAERLGINLPRKSIVLIWKELEVNRAHCHTRKKSIKICVNSNLFIIDPEIYNYKLEATIFHELGHGLLNRGHIEIIDVVFAV